MSDPLDRSAERAAKFHRPDPFRDEGQNVFGEAPTSPAADSTDASNPFAAPQSGSGEELPYDPRGYETTYEHRGALLLGLDGAAALLLLFGVLLAIYLPVGWAILAHLLPVVALAASLPAMLLGYADLQAIRAGAMNPDGESSTLWGMRLGVLCVLGTLVYLTVVIYQIR